MDRRRGERDSGTEKISCDAPEYTQTTGSVCFGNRFIPPKLPAVPEFVNMLEATVRKFVQRLHDAGHVPFHAGGCITIAAAPTLDREHFPAPRLRQTLTAF